jgi:hypothetical protein
VFSVFEGRIQQPGPITVHSRDGPGLGCLAVLPTRAGSDATHELSLVGMGCVVALMVLALVG